jgi:cytochrome bd-type quinol oxidase subunit 2
MNVLDLLPTLVVVTLFVLLSSAVTATEQSSILKERYSAPLWRSKLWLIFIMAFVLIMPAACVFLFAEWNCRPPYFSLSVVVICILVALRVNLRRFPRTDGLAAAWAQSLVLCAMYCTGIFPALFVAVAASALGRPACS